MSPSAIIIGGGIGGLCTAIALKKAGLQVKLYERAAELGRVGAGITLWANALKVLQQLGVAEAIIAAGTELKQGMVSDQHGRRFSTTDIPTLKAKIGAPVVAIHRADLHFALLEAVGDGIVHLDAECVRVSQDDTQVTAHFADGRSASADILVAADGIHSAVRQQILPAITLRYAGYPAWRGVVNTADSRIDASIFFEAWGVGQRFGLLRLNPTQVYWFATENAPVGQTRPPAATKQYLIKQFAHWFAPVPDVLEATPAEVILHNDIYDFPPQKGWSAGRVVFLGDAIHPTTPNMGQGACMAIESALVLADCLQKNTSYAAAFAAYERRRQPRTAAITHNSWRIGQIGQWENPLLCQLRNGIMKLTPESLLTKQLINTLSYPI